MSKRSRNHNTRDEKPTENGRPLPHRRIRIPRRPRTRRQRNGLPLSGNCQRSSTTVHVVERPEQFPGVFVEHPPREPWYWIGSILRGPSGAREETQFGLSGHGRMLDLGGFDGSAKAPAIRVTTNAGHKSKRRRLTIRLHKNSIARFPKASRDQSRPNTSILSFLSTLCYHASGRSDRRFKAMQSDRH